MKRQYIIKSILLCFIFAGLSSCLKEAEKDKVYPIDPIPAGVQTAQVAYLTDYSKQTFFQLEENKEVATNSNADWDLAFESTANGWHVFLNSSRFMHAANTGETNFDMIFKPKKYKYHIDASSGNLDSTAFGQWGESKTLPFTSRKEVYILDMGLTATGSSLGYKKIVLGDFDGQNYQFKYANLDGSEAGDIVISKDSDKNKVFFSFQEGGKQVDIEPKTEDWDLYFTQYTTLLWDGSKYIEYIVRGVLNNQTHTRIAETSDIPFAEITKDDIAKLDFKEQQDVIGHEWKKFSLDTGTYTVDSKRIYIIEVNGNIYYKLRFTSYLNAEGQKGFPEFAFQVIL